MGAEVPDAWWAEAAAGHGPHAILARGAPADLAEASTEARRGWPAVGLVVCGVLALHSLACAPQGPVAHADAGARATPTVEVVPVVFAPLDTLLSLEGELTPFEEVAVRARASGFVSRVLVDRGSVVKAGQALVVIDAPELSAQRAEVDARVQVEQATLARLTAAAATPGAVAANEVDVAKATLNGDLARLQSLKAQESYLVITAPFDGVVTERDVHPGALVGPQAPDRQPLLRVQQVSKLRLTVAVPEAWVGAVTNGASAHFTVRTFPGETFEGVVRRSARTVDPKTRTMAVELDVDNANGRLVPGLFASVRWPVHRESPSAFVPASAVIQSTQRTWVARVAGGVVDAVTVQRGAPSKDLVEVFGELREGDQVARRGSEELVSGVAVRVKDARSTEGR